MVHKRESKDIIAYCLCTVKEVQHTHTHKHKKDKRIKHHFYHFFIHEILIVFNLIYALYLFLYKVCNALCVSA